MKLISIDEVKPGMVLGKSILREEDGTVLLRANAVLKPAYINKIRNMNYNFLYVVDNLDGESEATLEPIRDETHIKTVEILKQTYIHLSTADPSEGIEIHKVRDVINEIIDQILIDPNIVYHLGSVSAHDTYTFTHSVNITVLSLMVGWVMGLNRIDLEILGISALLHDIGKIFIEKNILNKPAKLDPNEYEIIKEHTKKGYELLKSKISISFLPAHVALQHHEREDGSGYPRGLTKKSIHLFSKIVAVSDVYDAMTSQRVYQNPTPPYLVIREIMANSRFKYDEEVVANFTKVIAPFAKGSVLRLSDGEIAVVTHVARFTCLLKIIEGVNEGRIFNLYQQPEITVIQQLS